MAIHPPLLYMGYVGFSVAFAFAVAALMKGNQAQYGHCLMDASLDKHSVDVSYPRYHARQFLGLL